MSKANLMNRYQEIIKKASFFERIAQDKTKTIHPYYNVPDSQVTDSFINKDFIKKPEEVKKLQQLINQYMEQIGSSKKIRVDGIYEGTTAVAANQVKLNLGLPLSTNLKDLYDAILQSNELKEYLINKEFLNDPEKIKYIQKLINNFMNHKKIQQKVAENGKWGTATIVAVNTIKKNLDMPLSTNLQEFSSKLNEFLKIVERQKTHYWENFQYK